MAEALFNASGMGLPVVMTVANRAIGAPINIWNDHSDTMALRDAGWIQLFAATNQEAADLHVQAFRLAELVSLPVMVCMDGFVLTHAFEEVDVPDQGAVDDLPAFRPRQQLDPDDPMSIGALVGPEAFMEAKLLVHAAAEGPRRDPPAGRGLPAAFGRDSGGLLQPYRLDDADTVVVGLGSVLGTLEVVADALRDAGVRSVCSASRASGRGPGTRSAPHYAAACGWSWWRGPSLWAPAGWSGRTSGSPLGPPGRGVRRRRRPGWPSGFGGLLGRRAASTTS